MKAFLYEEKRFIILESLIYILFVFLSLNIIIVSITGIENIHIAYIIILSAYIILLKVHNEDMKIRNYYMPIFIYVLIVLFGVFSKNNHFFYALRVGSYRIVFPLLFIIIFSYKNVYKDIDRISNNIIKVIFATSLIIALIGVVEIFYPDTIYSIYNGNITPHTTLIIDNEIVRRLLSISGNPINLGFQMIFGLLSAIVLIYQYNKKNLYITIICAFSSVIFTLILILTYSRAALMVAVVSVTTMIVLMVVMIYRNNKYKIKNLVLIVATIGVVLFILMPLLMQVDGFITRVASINIQSYFTNTRFLRALEAFDKDTSLIHYIVGHGIYQINNSSSYVFELGYASLFFESGLFGIISLLGIYIYSMYISIKNILFHYKNEIGFINNLFYFSILVGGLVAMAVEDIYMQQPFSLFMWLSTIYILQKEQEYPLNRQYLGFK